MKIEDSIKTVLRILCGIQARDVVLEKTDPEAEYPDTIMIRGVEHLDKAVLNDVLPTCIERII